MINSVFCRCNTARMKQLVGLWFIVFALSLHLGGCRKDPQTGSQIAYLLPQLQSATVTAMTVSTPEANTHLIQRQGQWHIADPVDFAADPRVVDLFLQSLLDAEEGKPIQVAPKDYAQLELDTDNGIEVTLTLASGQLVQLVFGKVDLARNSDDGAMFGAAAVARRYVRIIGKPDRVFLAPLSLVDLSSMSSLWTDTQFPRVALVKRLQLTQAGKVHIDVSRPQPFARFESVLEPVLPDSFRCFEAFLASGRCLAVANANVRLQAFDTTQAIALLVEDFLGMQYQFTFAAPVSPNATEIETAALNADFLNDGIAQQKVPFSVQVRDHAAPTTFATVALASKSDNLRLARRYQQRVAYMNMEAFYCLTALLEASNAQD